MSDSPLNYSAVDYDFVGLQVHASGELWSADQLRHPRGHDARWGDGTPACRRLRHGADAGRPRARVTGAGSSWSSTRSC